MNKTKYISIALMLFLILLGLNNFILINIGELESNVFLAISILAISILTYSTKQGKTLISFVKSSIREIQIITWLSTNKTLKLSAKVLTIIIISTIVIFFMDNINTYIIEKTILKG